MRISFADTAGRFVGRTSLIRGISSPYASNERSLYASLSILNSMSLFWYAIPSDIPSSPFSYCNIDLADIASLLLLLLFGSSAQKKRKDLFADPSAHLFCQQPLVNRDDLSLVVAPACFTNPVGHSQCTTFAAFDQVWRCHFPVCPPLIPS